MSSRCLRRGKQHSRAARSPRKPIGKLSPQKGRSNQRCHNCGGVGHFWRNCTVTRRALCQEFRGTNADGKHHSNPSSNSLANKDDEIKGTMTRTLTCTIPKEQAELVLGSKVEKMVLVDGQEVKALINTGSPVSIISLQCVLQAWKDGKDHGLSESI